MEEETSIICPHPQENPEVDVFGICVGSKTVLRYDCSEKVCLQCGISCALSDKAVPNHVLFGSVDFSHPALMSSKLDSHLSGSNTGSTSGFLRCIDDPDGHLKDLSSLQKFIGIQGKSPLFLVPAPLGIESREKLLNVVIGEEEAVHLPPSSRKLFNFTEAISLSFLHSSEGIHMLRHCDGRLNVLVVEVGEDYSCASSVQVNLVHDQTDATNVDNAEMNVASSETPVSLSSSFPVDRLQLSIMASEGHLGFGYHDMDEILLQDWLAILYHLAKSLRLKTADTSMRLSKEALEGHNKLHAGGDRPSTTSEKQEEEEVVNVVEGFRWWLKLSPSSRSHCLRALHIFRIHNGGHRNPTVKATEYDRLLANHSFMKQLAAAETFEEQVEFLTEFLMDECDSILQSLTSWVSFQSAKVLKQLLTQYGHEKIVVEVQAGSVRSGEMPKIKRLIIDAQRDIMMDDDQHSQNDTSSMAGTIYYESYSRPMLRSHVHQLLKSLKAKLRILPQEKDFSGDRKPHPLDSDAATILLLWNEVSIADEDIGQGAVNRIIFEEVRREMSIFPLPNQLPETDKETWHHSSEPYSCGPLITTAQEAGYLAYHLPSRLILQGIAPLAAYVAAEASHHEVISSPLYRHLTLTENVCTSAWCGNLGFSLIYEEKRKAHHHIDVAPENVIWLTDFVTPFEQLQPFQRKRLTMANALVLKLDIEDTVSAPTSSGFKRHGMDGSLAVFRGHVEEFDAQNEELPVLLKRMSQAMNAEQFFFQPLSPTMQFQGDAEDPASTDSQTARETDTINDQTAIATEPTLLEAASKVHAMVTLDPAVDRCGSISVHCSHPLASEPQLPHDITENTHVDDSLVSSSSVHSADHSMLQGHLNLSDGNGHSLHNSASHLVNHELQHRRMHYFYQRSNRHRRDHSTRHHHLHHHWSSASSLHHHHSHSHHHVSHQHNGSSGSSQPHQHHSPGHMEPKKKEYHWKLVLVRSASFYTVSNRAHAVLMADSDNEDDGLAMDSSSSLLHDTVVQENLHIVHAIDLQQQESWAMPFHQVQYVSLEIDPNGIISVVARPVMTKTDMSERFPCPPTPPELVLPPPLTDAEVRAQAKADEIIAIKRELLSLIPPFSHYLEDTDHATQLKASKGRKPSRGSTSRPADLSPKASRLASMTFGALLLLYLAFVVFLMMQAMTLWFPGSASTFATSSAPGICDGSELSSGAVGIRSEGYTPVPPPAYWLHNCSESIVGDDIDGTTIPPSAEQSQHCQPDAESPSSSSNTPTRAEEKEPNACQRQQMIFASASPLAKLRYTIRRFRQNVTKTLDYVRHAVVYTITRFPFAFRAS